MIPSRPAEKLLEIDAKGLAVLLDDHAGNLAGAAYHLAILLNAARGYVRPTPSGAEVYAAAKRICAECDLTLWGRNAVINECHRLGLEVL